MKLIKAILNNKDESAYIKGFGRLVLYKMDGRAPKGLSRDSYEMKKIEKLETEIRYHNFQIYMDTTMKLIKKKLKLFSAVVTLSTTVGSLFVPKLSSTKSMTTYNKEEYYFDEEKSYMLEKDDTIYVDDDITNFQFGFPINKKYKLANINGNIILYINTLSERESVDTYSFSINPNSNIIIDNSSPQMRIPNFNLMDITIDEISEEEILCLKELCLQVQNRGVDQGKEITSLYGNDKNDLLVHIVKFVPIGKEDIELNFIWPIRFTLLGMSVLSLIPIFRKGYRFNVPKLKILANGYLEEDLNDFLENPSKFGILYYKEFFLTAERERILEIAEILKQNGVEESMDGYNIFTKYEKKLIKREKE